MKRLTLAVAVCVMIGCGGSGTGSGVDYGASCETDDECSAGYCAQRKTYSCETGDGERSVGVTCYDPSVETRYICRSRCKPEDNCEYIVLRQGETCERTNDMQFGCRECTKDAHCEGTCTDELRCEDGG